MSRSMKDSGIAWIGQVPEHWTVAPVRSVLKEVTAKNIFGKETTALQFRYGTIVEKDNFDATEDEYVARTIRNYTLIYPGVLVLNGLNLNYDFVTKRVALSRLKGAITSAYMTITPIDTHVLMPEFVEYLFKSYDAKMAFHGMGEGVRKILNFNELKRQPIIYPTYTEQKRIVQVLDKKCAEIDTLSNSIQQQIDTLEQYKRAVITETVTKGLNPSAPMKDSGIPWIGQIPAHWGKCKIKNACSLIGSGTTPDSTVPAFYEDGTVNWIQSGDIYGKLLLTDVSIPISEHALKSSSALKIYKAPFIVIAMYGGSVGNTAISMIDACTNQACCCLKPNNDTDLKFLFYWINFCKPDFLFRAEGGGQPNISQNKIKNQILCMPPKSEQQAIAEYLDNKCSKIDTIIQDKQQQLEKLEQYKKATIFEYVTGKKQVPEV